jgi:adenylate cyclase
MGPTSSPLDNSPPLPTAPGLAEPKSQVRVLVVDDQAGICAMFRRLLVQAGVPDANILQAASAEEALGVLARTPVDMVFTDYRMETMTGVELLAWLHEHRPSALGVLMTGYHEQEIAADAINRGHAQAFIHKPWDNQELVTSFERLLQEQRQRVLREQAMARSLNAAARIVREMPAPASPSGSAPKLQGQLER